MLERLVSTGVSASMSVGLVDMDAGSFMVAVAETRQDVEAELWPDESVAVERAMASRRREYATTRDCARRALAQLGIAARAIPTLADGAPGWPDGVIGSLTHCRGFRGAAVAWRGTPAVAWVGHPPSEWGMSAPTTRGEPPVCGSAGDGRGELSDPVVECPGPSPATCDPVGAPGWGLLSLGIDAEPAGGLRPGVLRRIGDLSEVATVSALMDQRPETFWDRVLFSAKESVYKAWRPLTGVGLDFHQVVVDPRPDGCFTVRFTDQLSEAARGLRWWGRWLQDEGLIVTAIEVWAPVEQSADQSCAVVKPAPDEASDPASAFVESGH